MQCRRPGTPAHSLDFNDVFCRLAAEGRRYREIAAPLIMGTAGCALINRTIARPKRSSWRPLHGFGVDLKLTTATECYDPANVPREPACRLASTCELTSSFTATREGGARASGRRDVSPRQKLGSPTSGQPEYSATE